MIKLNIKPLSVNAAYNGRRTRTKEYNLFIRHLSFILPKNLQAPEGIFYVLYQFGLSNTLSDYDGPIKAFQDVLQKFYKFNDKKIKGAFVQKVKVDKGSDYIKFEFFGIDQKIEFLNKINEVL